MQIFSLFEGTGIIESKFSRQDIPNNDRCNAATTINGLLSEYVDVEWVLYNIALLALIIYLSHIITVAYKCNREHSRKINKIYVEKKWLDSRINLISRKHTALKAIIKQLKREIYRETLALNVIDNCGKRSLERLESKKLEDIEYACKRLSKLESSNALLKSRILNFKASISSEISAGGVSSYNSSLQSPNAMLFSRLHQNNSEDPLSGMPDKLSDNFFYNLDSLVTINDMFVENLNIDVDPTSHKEYNQYIGYPFTSPTNEIRSDNNNIDEEEDDSVDSPEEEFTNESTSMLSLFLDTNITPTMLILKLEDLAIRYNARHEQCLFSVARALLDKSGLLDKPSIASNGCNSQRLDDLLSRFSKLISHYVESSEDKHLLKSFLTSLIQEHILNENLGSLALEEFSRHGILD